jgi:AcrR family transcriptional regulator
MTRQAEMGGDGTEPPATLRSRHAEATRRAVLDAARSLFGRQGYAQTSVEEIADAALVTKGAVYHHFAGKKALFRAVYDEVEADAQARALPTRDGRRSTRWWR